LPLDRIDPLTVAAFLTACLSERSPAFASRLAQLNRREARILYDHLKRLRPPQAKPASFTKSELRAITVACESFPVTSRFLRHLRRWLVPLLHKVYPALAKKVSRLSGRQLDHLYEDVKARRKEAQE
jgi:hypothetical protein